MTARAGLGRDRPRRDLVVLAALMGLVTYPSRAMPLLVAHVGRLPRSGARLSPPRRARGARRAGRREHDGRRVQHPRWRPDSVVPRRGGVDRRRGGCRDRRLAQEPVLGIVAAVAIVAVARLTARRLTAASPNPGAPPPRPRRAGDGSISAATTTQRRGGPDRAEQLAVDRADRGRVGDVERDTSACGRHRRARTRPRRARRRRSPTRPAPAPPRRPGAAIGRPGPRRSCRKPSRRPPQRSPGCSRPRASHGPPDEIAVRRSAHRVAARQPPRPPDPGRSRASSPASSVVRGTIESDLEVLRRASGRCRRSGRGRRCVGTPMPGRRVRVRRAAGRGVVAARSPSAPASATACSTRRPDRSSFSIGHQRRHRLDVAVVSGTVGRSAIVADRGLGRLERRRA